MRGGGALPFSENFWVRTRVGVSVFKINSTGGCSETQFMPVEGIDLISKVTDRLFSWTHYYDKKIITENKIIKHRFKEL
jgi:hypothetical protein